MEQNSARRGSGFGSGRNAGGKSCHIRIILHDSNRTYYYMSGSFSNLLLCCNIQRGASSQRVALRDAIVDVPFRLHIFLLPKYQCGLGGDICRLLDRGLRNMGDNRILRYLQGIKEITRLAISEAFILVRQA